LKGSWAEPDVRDEVVDYIRCWSDKTGIKAAKMIQWIGIHRSKYYDWASRYGKVNEHNAWIPRDFWLADWEKQAIMAYYHEHPLEGYRRLTYMMMDDDIVAVSPRALASGCGLRCRFKTPEPSLPISWTITIPGVCIVRSAT
jgi:putative transposase